MNYIRKKTPNIQVWEVAVLDTPLSAAWAAAAQTSARATSRSGTECYHHHCIYSDYLFHRFFLHDYPIILWIWFSSCDASNNPDSMSLVKAASAWFILSKKSAPETSMPPSSSVGEHTENRRRILMRSPDSYLFY